MPNYIIYVGFVIINFLGYYLTYGTDHFNCLLSILIFVFIGPRLRFVYNSSKKRRIKEDSLLIKIIGLGLLITFCGAMLMPSLFFSNKPEYKYLHIFLMTLCSLALLLWRHSMNHMGDMFVDGIYKSDALITKGPFTLSRNPIYLSYIILFMSLLIYKATLVQNNIAFWELLLIILTVHLGTQYIKYRIDEEEKVLSAFGSEYDQYINSTPRLIPTFKSIMTFLKLPFMPFI